jgi:hypothetical protein
VRALNRDKSKQFDGLTRRVIDREIVELCNNWLQAFGERFLGNDRVGHEAAEKDGQQLDVIRLPLQTLICERSNESAPSLRRKCIEARGSLAQVFDRKDCDASRLAKRQTHGDSK